MSVWIQCSGHASAACRFFLQNQHCAEAKTSWRTHSKRGINGRIRSQNGTCLFLGKILCNCSSVGMHTCPASTAVKFCKAWDCRAGLSAERSPTMPFASNARCHGRPQRNFVEISNIMSNQALSGKCPFGQAKRERVHHCRHADFKAENTCVSAG